jgi:hypothetical protein
MSELTLLQRAEIQTAYREGLRAALGARDVDFFSHALGVATDLAYQMGIEAAGAGGRTANERPYRTGYASWDWREQPDLTRLAVLVADLSDGRVHLRQVRTGTDEYAVVVAGRPMDDDQARSLWEALSEDGEMP